MLRNITKIILYFISTKYFLKFIGLNYGTQCRFINLKLNTFGSEPYLIKLGNHVTITSGVKFINHDGGVWVIRNKFPDIDIIKPINIGNNVFIGLNSIIMPGAKIGDNIVVGAGSVVTGNLASNAVYAGIPARKICSFQDYEKKLIQQGIKTKGLSFAKKKKFIMQLNKTVMSDN